MMIPHSSDTTYGPRMNVSKIAPRTRILYFTYVHVREDKRWTSKGKTNFQDNKAVAIILTFPVPKVKQETNRSTSCSHPGSPYTHHVMWRDKLPQPHPRPQALTSMFEITITTPHNTKQMSFHSLVIRKTLGYLNYTLLCFSSVGILPAQPSVTTHPCLPQTQKNKHNWIFRTNNAQMPLHTYMLYTPKLVLSNSPNWKDNNNAMPSLAFSHAVDWVILYAKEKRHFDATATHSIIPTTFPRLCGT